MSIYIRFSGLTAHGMRILLMSPPRPPIPIRCGRGVNFLSLLLLAMTVLPVSANTADKWHAINDIRETAADFVSRQAHKEGEQQTVTAAALDQRLRMARCSEPLEAYLPAGGRIAANTTVGVRCAAPRPWKLFVGVRRSVAADVLVAAHPLVAGNVLNKNDFISAKRDLTQLHGGYIRPNEAIAGMVLRRNVQEGKALRKQLLNTPKVVQRGQQISIGTRGGSVSIRMAGTALSDGRQGQRIRVKNRSSGRIIEGIVRSSHLVEIGLD